MLSSSTIEGEIVLDCVLNVDREEPKVTTAERLVNEFIIPIELLVSYHLPRCYYVRLQVAIVEIFSDLEFI